MLLSHKMTGIPDFPPFFYNKIYFFRKITNQKVKFCILRFLQFYK